MQNLTKIIVAILLGALIIGASIFLGLTYKSNQPAIVSSSKTSNNYQKVVTPVTPTVNKSSVVAPVASCGASENTIVTKVIDGDTVVVLGGYHVRLLGIDADEKNYPCYDAAKNRLESLVLNAKIRLDKDVTDVDQYGRCLRTIFLGDENVDVEMVKEGLAVARFYPPDVKYKSEISVAESEAMQNKTGCKWGNVK